MKTLISLCLCVMLATAAMAAEVGQTLDADPRGRVTISNLAGSVEVRGWDRNQVEVTGTIGEDVEELIFTRDGRETLIKVKVPERKRGRLDVTTNLVVRIPEGSSLEVSTVSADIEVQAVRGEQELQSVSGDVTTQGFAADVQAETVSGDVEITGSGKDAAWELSSVSGDVEADNVSGTLAAEVVSGDIDVQNGSFSRIRLETVNGDIRFAGTLRKDGKMDVETVNGGVEIDFAGEVSARFDIETFNGRIRNCFGPKPERSSRHGPGWELRFKEGEGEGRVSVSTLNGSLEICKG